MTDVPLKERIAPRNPGFVWPNGANIAVTITVGFELWGQTVEPNLLAPFPKHLLDAGKLDHGTLSWAEYGGRAGIWRVMRILEKHGVDRATIALNGVVAEHFPEAACALRDRGDELCAHSYRQDLAPFLMEEGEEEANIERTVKAIEDVTGIRPVGWISPAGRPTDSTRRLLARAGFRWHGDCSDDDLPYMEHTEEGPIVAVPYLCYDINDYHLYARGKSSPQVYVDMFRRSFDLALSEARTYGVPRMVNASVHPHVFGRAAGAWALDDCLEYATSHGGEVWFAARQDLAEVVHAVSSG